MGDAPSDAMSVLGSVPLMAEANRTSMRAQWRFHKALWNASGGRLGRRIGGFPIVEVVTIGHQSGAERQILISFVDADGAPAIIGSNAGRDADPAWVKNLRAQPAARARWDGTWHDVVARELHGDERDAVWDEAVERNPGYEDYADGMTRTIPIFRLEPAVG